ncbi:MAG: cation:dicarboxylase symporter family transporter [Alphaproteobacteria bacterium]|nr:cation:dicarboxylase symporter family transporter [Alphaproteobacteria bacterium]
MFRKMPFILVAIIIVVIFLAPFCPLVLKQGLYSISLSIKDVIVLLLPFIIFGLLFKAAVSLSRNATKIIGMILVFVCVSNFTATFLSHYVGIWIYHFDLSMLKPHETGGLEAMWVLNLPKLIANDKAMFTGIVFGIIASKCVPAFAFSIADKAEKVIGAILQCIVAVIPVFVAGFVIKLQHDGVVGMIIKDYTMIFVFIALAQFTYISLAYFLLNNGKVRDFIANVSHMLPAAISGFSTMSSAASMPLTIMGAEKSAKDKNIARSVIPATVNIHLIGDCFAIPIFAYAVLKSFGMEEPSLLNYLIFALYFVLAKFSVAAIPGGGILVMLPILESYLGFNAEMMSLITALYILFDPVITCANVLGNGAFAKMIDNVLGFLGRKTVTASPK